MIRDTADQGRGQGRMAKTRIALELGMGTSLRKGDYTRAAVRAVQDALWRNSISFAEAFGFEKSDMLIDVEIGVQQPDAVDADEVKAVLQAKRRAAWVRKDEGRKMLDDINGMMQMAY